jgi:N-acetylglucosaminyl-diphospho-decaprenol L-rhamnosyltransferase
MECNWSDDKAASAAFRLFAYTKTHLPGRTTRSIPNMSEPAPLLTTLLVSFNTRDLLTPCLDALAVARAPLGDSPVIVVDNASADGSAEYLEHRHPDVKVIRSGKNLGFGRANNLGLPEVRSKYLLLLNTDAFVPADALTKTLAFMEATPSCGILGVRLVGRDGDLQPSCRYFPTPYNTFLARSGLARWLPPTRMVDEMDWAHDEVRECDWVPGCFYLVRSDMLPRVGLFDPRYFLYYEEVDHCAAAKAANFKVYYYPHVSVVHIGGESAKSLGAISAGGRQVEVLQIESAQIYFRKQFGLAGMLWHLFLEEVADLVLIAKAVLQRKGWREIGYHLRRMRSTLSIAGRTRLGLQATR